MRTKHANTTFKKDDRVRLTKAAKRSSKQFGGTAHRLGSGKVMDTRRIGGMKWVAVRFPNDPKRGLGLRAFRPHDLEKACPDKGA